MDRIALVIGNSNYLNAGKLNNPVNDAKDIERVLKKLSFNVNKIIDANLSDIQLAVNDFLKNLDDYATGLLFYAGHGMQIDGKNYIVPIDCSVCDKGKTIVSCYCVNSLLDGISSYKGKTFICILDACRNNPFVASRGLKGGFAQFDNPPKGTIIAYSTSTDSVAFDGQNSNGLYTQVLKDALAVPNIKIEEMFKSVRKSVSEISIKQYGEEQLSWEYSSLVGDFYFSVTSQSVNREASDKEIYDFIRARYEFYEKKTDDVYDIECLAYVDAYNEFNIPIIKLLRAYSRIDYQNNGYHFSDATIDQINYNYLISWGFKQKYGRWYYKNHYVEMGDLLPLSDEMKPLEPIKDMEFEVNASVKIEEKEGKLRFCLSSNIPEETPLIFTLHGKSYSAQCKINAGKTETISEWFSDKCNPINNGFYTIKITCPIFDVLPVEVKKIFGERSRNLTGRYVRYDPIGGNTICILYGIVYNGNSIHLVDMQQNIS